MVRFVSSLLVAVVALAALDSQSVPAATVAYDVVYVRAPRPNGDARESRMADVFRPLWVEPGSDLMLLHPDGSEEVLFSAGKDGAVADPCVSFDAKWVYYSFFPDAKKTTDSFQYAVAGGADIYKVNIQTKEVVRLTNQEYTPNTSVRTSPLSYGIYNMGPCPVSGGKIVFTSNRNGFIPTKGFTPVASQLYVMDEDGSNVHAIAPLTLGAALHPFQLKDGRVAFSSYESQGLRDSRSWALWAIWPDGRVWEPLMSSFGLSSVLHFAAQLSGGDVVVEDYYNLNNNGFGAFYRFPTTQPVGGARFHPASLEFNPPLGFDYKTHSNVLSVRFPFSPVGIQSFTPFTHPFDEAAPVAPDGKYVGKVTQPSGAPNGELLLVWTPGPANNLSRPTSIPAYDAGLYLARNNGPITSHQDLVLIKNDPRYNEQWPRAVVPYSAIYGVAEPHKFPFLPNDGTVHSELPEGTPYGIVGTSSFYKRESFPGRVIAGLNYDGLEPFNSTVADSINWFTQGSEAGKYSNDEIDAVRILAMEPTTDGTRKWFNHANERLRILGEIRLRKVNANGTPVLDPEGNPDTSFWAKIPADTPFTFQMIDSRGRLLTMAQTWHQVRPGEKRVDCGGCHAHSQTPLAFEATAAFNQPLVDLTQTPARDVEFVRDIRPLLQQKCASCHRGANAPAGLALDSTANVAAVAPDSGVPMPKDYAVLARNSAGAHGGYKAVKTNYYFPNSSRYVRKFQSRRSLLMWKLAGARLDGWTNEQWPTEAEPGNAATLPAAGLVTQEMADLDYHDTANHGSMLTAAEQRLVATWIDLGAPIDLGGGYWDDEIRPTLTLKATDGQLIVGAADAYSGLDAGSLNVTVNGSRLTLSSLGGGRWSGPFSGVGVVVAKVKDNAGNWTEQNLRFGGGITTSKGPRPPTNVRLIR